MWRGEQIAEGVEAPLPLLTGLALFVCAEAWQEARAGEDAYGAVERLTVRYVTEAELLVDHPGFEHVFGDSPEPYVVRIAVDAPADPLRALGHECGHVVLEHVFGIGFTDDTHSTPGVWGAGNLIEGVVQPRIAELLTGR